MFDKWDSSRPQPQRRPLRGLFVALCILASLSLLPFSSILFESDDLRPSSATLPRHAPEIIAKCKSLKQPAGPPHDFHDRRVSERWVPGTSAVYLKNATIWVGKGHDVIHGGNILLDKGMIKRVSRTPHDIDLSDINVVDVGGAWVTPGIFDMHSHIGADSSPEFKGSDDTNSFKGPAQPWLRVLDGLNTHDLAYELVISGGITTALVLPGSAGAIGGQAFAIKLRPTAERTTSSKLLEPPHSINGSAIDPSHPPRWRQMKHACGENPSAVYGFTRMDTQYAFRSSYEEARKIKVAQDNYCEKVEDHEWQGLGDFPESLQWEALVDVLRGRVKIHNHCYEAVDFDGMVRLTQEFKFPIAAFHHAHEAYLVPDLLKKAYGPTPAIALFSTNARYKREAYRGSEFAPQILSDNGIRVAMKSDHPVLNSRHLLYEAQTAHYYGLDADLALASVTSTPAEVAGYDHRIGYLKDGYDANLVVWDSHPLALGATPKQVYIDGIPQLKSPVSASKPSSFQVTPKTPNFDDEAAAALKYEGLPPLVSEHKLRGIVVLTNVAAIHSTHEHGVSSKALSANDIVVVQGGKILCSGKESACMTAQTSTVEQTIDLQGGSLAPGLVSYGAPLGSEEIQAEPSTQDGRVFSLIDGKNPDILGDGPVIRAVDGLQFQGRDALLAYRAGITTAVTSPSFGGFLSGLSVAFSLGSSHRLETGAVKQDVAALHIAIGHRGKTPSISTQIAVLRRLLMGGGEGDLKAAFAKVVEGKLPLVIDVRSADIMATLLDLKKEVEQNVSHGASLKITFAYAAEAHLLAKEIGHAGVGVIVNPVRPLPLSWEGQRILPGPPTTKETPVAKLLAHNVTVGIGIEESWSARGTRFDAGWVALDSDGFISEGQAMAIASVNLNKLLGVSTHENFDQGEVVAYQGGSGSIFNFEAKPVAVISPSRGFVDVF